MGKNSSNRSIFVISLVASLAVGIGVGVLIGWFSKPSDEPQSPYSALVRDADPTISRKLFSNILADNIKNNLRQYTAYSHLAGTPGDERLLQEIKDAWTTQGLDLVTRTTYDVLLSYPNDADPSRVFLLDNNNITQHTTAVCEPVLIPEQNSSDVILQFNAYSPSGDVTGDLVYVNYGRIEDFRELHDVHNINLTGKIAIARYGKIYRGDKVKMAADFGAIGIIIYSDPADHNANLSNPVFPDSEWLPGFGVQRGTTLIGDADPLTLGYPATETAYRLEESKANMLPKIPVHPIGYDDAYEFLKLLSGPRAPPHWQGGLNVSYNFGPGFIHPGWKTHLHVTTQNKRVNISNLFGYINGTAEPDRYVLLGNHRDAWVFGGVDPTSGTALMVELSRVFMDIVRTGWRPRRTIVFCSWGAEEYGLIGSYEWVEEFVKILGSRAVAYLNVDYSLDGYDSMYADAMPTLFHSMIQAASLIESPIHSGMTLLEDWVKSFPELDKSKKKTGRPSIGTLGDASDHGGFVIAAGIPSYDAWYTYTYNIVQYPLYHTAYDSYKLVNDYLDPGHKIGVAIGQFWAETARHLADALVLPLNVSEYAHTLQLYVQELEKGYGESMNNHSITLDALYEAVRKFQVETDKFHASESRLDKQNPLAVRAYNDQLMMVDRVFIDPQGLPTRPVFKHIIYAPSQFDSYSGSTFPGLTDLMYDIDNSENPAEQWDRVRQHLATIIFCVDAATATLRPATDFMHSV